MQNIFTPSKNKSFKERSLAILMAFSMVLQGGTVPLLAYANENESPETPSVVTATSTEPVSEVGEIIETSATSSEESFDAGDQGVDNDENDDDRNEHHKIIRCYGSHGAGENDDVDVDSMHHSHGDSDSDSDDDCRPPRLPPSRAICSVDIFSDAQTAILGGGNAVPTYSAHPAWTAQIPGATWMWSSYLVLNPTQDETVSFTRSFNLTTVPVAGSLVIAADNSYAVALNGNPVGSDNAEYNFADSGKDTYNVLLGLHVGVNTIAFTVKNWAQAGGSSQSNPAGLLYKLHVDLAGFGCTPPPPVNQKPVITVNPVNPTTVVQFATYADAGATAADPEDGNITSHIVTTGSVNTAVVGTYTITYNVVDSLGLAADTKKRTVNVISGFYLPPMPSCVGNYATVISSVDGWGFHDDDVPEHYTVYSGDNKPIHGNTLDNTWVHGSGTGHSITWDMGVGQTTKTVRVFPSNDHGSFPAEFNEYNVVISADNVTWSAPLVASTTYVGDIMNVKVHDGVKDVVSASSFRYVRLIVNNISGDDFEIDAVKPCLTQVQNQKPVITVNPVNPTTVVQFATYADAGATAADPEDGNITSHIVTTGSVNTAVVGTYTITYNVVDSLGLAADTKTRTVYVIPAPKCSDHVDNDHDGLTDYPADTGCDNAQDNDENNKPVITVVGTNPVAVTMGDSYVDAGATAADNEDGNITNKIFKSGSVNTGILGAYTITYNATDSQNLSADTKTRIVNVVAACSDGKDNDGDHLVDYPADLGCSGPIDNDENTKPVITLVGANPLELTIGDVFVEPGRTAADAEEGNITAHIVTTGTVNTAVLGTYTLTYNVADSHGLAADTKTRTVHVNKVITQCNDGIDNDGDHLIDYPSDTGCENSDDNNENNKPVITVVGANPMLVHWNATFTDPAATASDLEDGNITASIIATGTVNTAVLGTYTITYKVADSKGLAADTKTRTVNVVSSCSDGLDNDNDGLTDYPADPGCGNPADDSENSKPVISLLGDVAMSLMLGTTYVESSATVADQEDGNITNKLKTTGFVDMSTLGAYLVKYNATDSMALAANEVTRTVTVVAACADGKDNDGDGLVDYPHDLGCGSPTDNNENDPPVITLLGANPMNITIGGVFVDPGTTAFDPEDLDISTTTITTGTVNTAVLGSYTVHYNVTDSDGLAAVEKTRVVNVTPPVTQCNDGVDNDGDGRVDYPNDGGCDNSQDNDENNKPIITVVGANPMTIQLNASFVDPSATVADQEDGNITATKLVTTGTVDTNTLGVYTLTYNATDTKNLAADTKTRTVKIVSACSDGIDNDGDGLTDYPLDIGCGAPTDNSENSKPVISLLGDASMTLTVGSPYVESSATVADPEEGNITSKLVISGSVNTNVAGIYAVSYNAMDSHNLAADQKMRTVKVIPAVCTQNCGGGSSTFDYYGCTDPSAINYNSLANKDDSSCKKGGGGGGPVTLTISNEKVTSTGTTSVVVTWDTNISATNRVVYGLEPVATLGTAPLYGYGLTTATDTTLTTTHTMTVEGIPSAVSAYFRPVSSANTQTVAGIELTRGGVLGESTECSYINEYMRLGANNNPVEVTKLQTFLRNYEGFTTLEINGFFDTTTDAAVRAFQDKYIVDILGMWKLSGNTGYVYYTTQKKINEIYCKREFPLTTSQITEIAAFHSLVNKIKSHGGTAPVLPLVGVNTKGPNVSVSSIESWVGTVNENGGTLSATVVAENENPTTTVATRGKVRLSDLLATMPHVGNELSGTKTDSDIAKEPGVVAGASTKRGLATVMESVSGKLHLSNASLYFIATIVFLTLLLTALYFKRRNKVGEEIEVE